LLPYTDDIRVYCACCMQTGLMGSLTNFWGSRVPSVAKNAIHALQIISYGQSVQILTLTNTSLECWQVCCLVTHFWLTIHLPIFFGIPSIFVSSGTCAGMLFGTTRFIAGCLLCMLILPLLSADGHASRKYSTSPLVTSCAEQHAEAGSGHSPAITLQLVCSVHEGQQAQPCCSS